ncbi:hypothetical protein [Allorhodopirellula solitaria]|uniref:Periplasmic folding chaperone n=1 Tax=Allorhodopirellula solitaria TaxID=2527987 RepID=A0A5C5XQ09_9BACT|nr:hypothetical protein [Allorhodopirellula solitaria]TWT65316.1 hypothetical protein CA85_32280 [Allorhodopirellula solitaria]
MSSSPFEIFRRNLKPLMVFLTLLALFSFVVLPALDTYMRRGGGMNSNPVAASYDGIELTRTRVARTTQNHRSVVRFLFELANETLARGGVPQTPGFQFDEQSGQIRAIGIDANPSEEATIHTLRFYHEAEKAGFELDDVQIKDWLTRFSDGTVSDSEISSMLMQSSGRQLGPQHLYEQLRMHLLADLYQRGALVGLSNGQMPIVTPLGQWENFLKMSQQATVNAYGVLASEYFDKTDKNPSQSDIQDTYDAGRERISFNSDDSRLPGFRRPDSAEIEYVAAHLEQFLEAEKSKLTEEQLRAEYDRRLAGGDFQIPADAANPADMADPAAETSTDELSLEDTSGSSDENTAVSEESMPSEEAESNEEAASDEEAASGEEAAAEEEVVVEEEAMPSEEPTATEESTTEESTTEESVTEESVTEESTMEESEAEESGSNEESEGSENSEEAAAEDEPTEEAVTEEEPAEPAEEESSLNRRRNSAVQLVAFQDEEGDSPVEPADDAAVPESETEPQTPAEPEPAEQAEMPAEASDDSDLDLDDEPAPTQSQSFEEVRDQIATELASGPARQALDNAVTEANKRMRRYFSELAVHESNVSVGVQTADDAPKRLDLKKMAAELGLQYGQSDELVNRVSVQEIAPGNSFGLGSGMNQRGAPYSAMMFGSPMQDGSVLPPQPVFSPLRSVDLEAGVTYISWKTEDVRSYIPELDEARDEIVHFLRMGEAKELAKAAADEIAAAVQDGEKTLAEAIPADKKENLIEGVGPFSWLDQVGFMQTVPAEVPELDAVGDDFMRAVFTTKVGQYAVAANDPQTVYYVVTPTEFQPEMDLLREQFRQPQQRIMAQMLGSQDARKLIGGYLQSVDRETSFELNLGEEE